MVEKIKPSFVVKDDRLAGLRALLPEAVADGAIHWESLKESLAEFLEDAEQEHFGLSWPGKREAKKMAFVPPKATLRPRKGEGVDEEDTGNLIIEGDNLEVLKLLQKSYFQSVKMIYIDPPYNTGNDFVYNDNFTDTVEDYLRKTGQLDAEGKPLATNPRTSGRYHSNWLSMMYPRLVLAKNLLRDDGVIFVSIDDNEVHHLRQIMDEIFGEENFVATVIWQKKYSPANDKVDFSTSHDYITVYSKKRSFSSDGKAIAILNREGRSEEMNEAYSKPDNDPRGPWKAGDYTCNKSIDERPNLNYAIINPITKKEIWPNKKGAWRYSKETHEQNVTENRIWWGSDGKNMVPAYKRFLSDVGDVVAQTIWMHQEVGHTDESKKELDALFNGDGPFSTPKPSRLLKKILQLSTNALSETDASTPYSSPDLILDFFAGSGTTAQAVLELNEEDGGDRKFILVQLPEPTGRKDYPTIADITKERVRRVIAKLNEPKKDAAKANTKKKAEGGLFVAEKVAAYAAAPVARDRGFRVLELAESNLRDWDPAKATDIKSLEKELDLFTDPLKPGWKREDLLVEILLWEGFSLTGDMEKRKVGSNTFIRNIDREMEYDLWVCLDEKLSFTQKDLTALGIGKDDVVVLLDSSLTDSLKSKLADMLKLKVV